MSVGLLRIRQDAVGVRATEFARPPSFAHGASGLGGGGRGEGARRLWWWEVVGVWSVMVVAVAAARGGKWRGR